MAKNPTLYLLKGSAITVDTVAAMYEAMTGKKPTAKELADAEAKLNAMK